MSTKRSVPKRATDLVSARQISVLIFLLAVALLLALPFILSAGQSFFLPVVAAAVIAIILSPIASALEKFAVPSVISSLTAIIVFALIIAGGLMLIAQPAINLIEQFPAISEAFTQRLSHFNSIAPPLSDYGKQVAENFERTAQNEVIVLTTSILQNAAVATPFILLQFLLILLTSYLMLISRTKFTKRLIEEREDATSTAKARRTLQQVTVGVSRYLGTVTLINLIFGCIVGIGAWLIGLDAPIMWGGLAALLNFVPYVGPLLFALLLSITGIVEADNLVLGLVPVMLYAAVQAIEANLITPLILGERFAMNPVLIIIAISYFSWIWGFPGALLSVPLLIILKVLIRNTGAPNFVGFFLGEKLFEKQNPINQG